MEIVLKKSSVKVYKGIILRKYMKYKCKKSMAKTGAKCIVEIAIAGQYPYSVIFCGLDVIDTTITCLKEKRGDKPSFSQFDSKENFSSSRRYNFNQRNRIRKGMCPKIKSNNRYTTIKKGF